MVRLVVMVLSFEIMLLNLVVRLLVVSIVVDVLTDGLGVLGSDQPGVVSIKVHLRVGILWLVVMLDFPSLVLLWDNLNMVTVLGMLSIDWLLVVMFI